MKFENITNLPHCQRLLSSSCSSCSCTASSSASGLIVTPIMVHHLCLGCWLEVRRVDFCTAISSCCRNSDRPAFGHKIRTMQDYTLDLRN
uniref:Uncharacterized protein n=1 Tax=Timema tahoe TaxID=61484 RepID=A0A7R9IT00_9NEOP|nr:unnamed protein product [Timema tahoe]